MSSLKNLIPYAKPYKKGIILNITFNVLYALFSTLSFLTLIPMLDILFGDEATKKIPKEPVYSGLSKIVDYGKDMMYFYVNQMISENDKQTALTFVIVIIIVTFMLKNLFNYLASFFIMHVRNGVMADLRKSMYKKIVSLPIGFYSEKRKGDVMARMLGDLGEVQGQFFAVLDLLVKDPLTILFSIVAMFMLSYKLMIFVFIFIPISGFVISLIGKSLKQQSSQAQQESGLFISMLEETLSGLKVVKSNNAENVFIKKFNDSIDRLLKLSNDIGTKNNLASPVSEFMGIVVIAVLLWYGGYLVMDEKSLKSSDFIAFMGLAYNILTPAKAISRASYSVKAGLAAAERVFHILDQHNPIADHQGSLVKTSFDNQVSFKNITFSYEEQIVLENFNLTIPKGKTYALVGQSGSGKSTIANLITRFYDVEHGTIEIDGINIKELKLDALRSLTGMVTQDSILFNDSIKNNILIGKPQASDAEVIEALKVANAWEFVKDLPKGIETNIGDAGSKLSGGQKQRLNIARTVLKNPPIMILDEATSALDTESEKVVQDALENMLQNRTSIVIAHRLSTIQNADCIVVMSRGKIVEQGTHDDLMNLENGYYARLVSLQSLERT
jgi:subfamily B ATP-binding cassette protein MsbA